MSIILGKLGISAFILLCFFMFLAFIFVDRDKFHTDDWKELPFLTKFVLLMISAQIFTIAIAMAAGLILKVWGY
jgi:uncharacterized membrane protein